MIKPTEWISAQRRLRSAYCPFDISRKDIFCLAFYLNPLVPNHRKHCPKTFILPTVTYFGKYIIKLHLKFLGGQRSRRYVCIIYNTLGIKCSQARVNNSRIKNLLGFICAFNIFIYLKDSFGKYISNFSLKKWLAGEFFILSKTFAQCIIYDTSNFLHFDDWKNIFYVKP